MDAARALHILRTTGQLHLTGAPSPGQVAARQLLTVLKVIVVILIVGCVVAFVGLAVGGAIGVFSAPGEKLITFGVIAAVLGAALIVILISIRHLRRVSSVARLPVEFDARGLTLRGVGPVPWTDFEPARVRMVQSRSDGAHYRAVIMPLTPSGLNAVNGRLPGPLRDRLGEVSGGLFSGNIGHRWIIAPSSVELHERDMIELINTARAEFIARRRR